MISSHANAAVPAVEFALQAVVPNFPEELHEAIVVTADLTAWAVAALPDMQAKAKAARNQERSALAISSGEASWRSAGGPGKARLADRISTATDFVGLLAAGKNSSGSRGWIDRREWATILESALDKLSSADAVSPRSARPSGGETPWTHTGVTAGAVTVEFGPTGGTKYTVTVPAGTACRKLEGGSSPWVVADLGFIDNKRSLLYSDAEHYGIQIPVAQIVGMQPVRASYSGNAASAFGISDEDVFLAATSRGADITLADADILLSSIDRADRSRIASAALAAGGDLGEQALAAQEAIITVLVEKQLLVSRDNRLVVGVPVAKPDFSTAKTRTPNLGDEPTTPEM